MAISTKEIIDDNIWFIKDIYNENPFEAFTKNYYTPYKEMEKINPR